MSNEAMPSDVTTDDRRGHCAGKATGQGGGGAAGDATGGATGDAVGGEAGLPATLQEIVEDFQALSIPDRLQLLLDFSRELPQLPPQYAEHPELLEPVPECQSPIFLATEVEGSGTDAVVHLYFSAPAEAPTTRGFAGILREGLDGLTAAEVLAVPLDLPDRLALAEAVSLLRLRGMSGMLGRIKRQVRDKIAA